jgi:thiamine pyrophosphate-dependent acetolactate synthase large subunit-like protein
MPTGAELLVEALVTAGVRHLFSLSGNQILPVYDATIGRGLSIVHTRHEAAAVHMADAWGRLTEEPGVALVTAGPGHLNAISALYGALMAESPVVFLSGHAPLAQAGRGAFQEMDQVAVARPVTKAAWLARDAAGLGLDMARALEIARSERPGPVHVSLPGDLLEARVTGSAGGAPGRAEASPPPPPALREMLDALAAARRPLIILGPAMGRAARRASVDRLSAITGVPALVMESPRGVNDPWLHMASGRLADADLVLLLGKRLDYAVRFGEAPAFAAGCRFIQVDADAGALAGSPRVSLALHADPAQLAETLAEAARAMTWTHKDWGVAVDEARRAQPTGWDALRGSSRRPIHPLRVCAALQPVIDAGATLVCDGGEFGQWVQAGVEAPTRLINGLSGSIGSAIPMAIGARLARPDRPVVAALGDGTFGFHAFELDTAARHRVPVVALVGNDARWNAEHQLQLQHYGADRTVGCELRPTRYDEVARALGGHGELVERPEDLEPALARALAADGPACVNVTIDGVAAPTYRTAPGTH